MNFIENLKTKLTADQLARRVIASLTPLESGRHTDLEAMAELLDMAGYHSRSFRDMTLYCPDFSIQPNKIMVLDNELPLYQTTIQDVLIRKSPTIKEMVSIRNAIKILHDTDVVLGKGKQAVGLVHREILDSLDLTYGPTDIESIRDMGTAALENADADTIVLCLSLFAELLDLLTAPKSTAPVDLFVLYQKEGIVTGDLTALALIYDKTENQLTLFDGIRTRADGKIVSYRQLTAHPDQAAYKDKDVFDWLHDRVIEAIPPVRHSVETIPSKA